jgi:hypothetical protein
MKTQLKFLLSLLGIVFVFQNEYAQSTFTGLGAAGHTGAVAAADWCGWNGATPIPFNLQHRGTADINFFTGGNAAIFQRATIKGTSYVFPGFFGVNTTLPLQQFRKW